MAIVGMPMIVGASHTSRENVSTPRWLALTTRKAVVAAMHAPNMLLMCSNHQCIGWDGGLRPIGELSAADEQADEGKGREELMAGAQAVKGRSDARRLSEARAARGPMDGDAGLVRVFARSTRTPPDTPVAVRIATKNRKAPASRPCGDGSVSHRVAASRNAVIETMVMPLTKTQPARRWVDAALFCHERNEHGQQGGGAAGDVQIQQ